MPATTSAIPINPPHGNRFYSMNGGDLDLHRVHVAGGDLDGLEMPAASPSDDLPSGSIETVNFAECGRRLQFNGGPSSTPHRSSDGTTDPSIAAFPVPFLPGEVLQQQCSILNGNLFVTNYRITIAMSSNRGCNIPLPAVDSIDTRDIFGLQISCKDGRVFRVSTESSELSLDWFKKLTGMTCGSRRLEDLFAFAFYTAVHGDMPLFPPLTWLHEGEREKDFIEAEFDRLAFSQCVGTWHICKANDKFELCDTYPRLLIMPSSLKDEKLKEAREGRFLQRIPTAVWRCARRGTVLMRSSQPRVGIFSWRNYFDEQILKEVIKEGKPGSAAACGGRMLIVDARSYTAAWANRAKGGGFESAEYYQQTEVQFMGLPNIHNIRYSFQQLRALLTAPQVDQATYLQALQATQWFLYLSNLIGSAVRCVDALCDEGRSVLVHCSDGWDRTTQIISLAKLIADSYYRSMKGFEELVRREWIEFGHKFADRMGATNGEPNERSPVFLQWLDCVYQLLEQFPCAFEFNQLYLVKLAQHSSSGLFGTFLWNSAREAAEKQGRTVSIWSYLNVENPQFVNLVYEPGEQQRLRPNTGVQDIRLWRTVYCCSAFEEAVNASEEMRGRAAGSMYGTDQTVTANSPGDVNQRSLTRAHSASSLSNADGASQSPNTVAVHHGSNSHIAAVHCQNSATSQVPGGMSGCTVVRCSSTASDQQRMDEVHTRDMSTSMTGLVPTGDNETDSQCDVFASHTRCNGGHPVGTRKNHNLRNRRNTGANATTTRRRYRNMQEAVDVDGLTRVENAVQEHMRNTVDKLQHEIDVLREKLRELEQERARQARHAAASGDGTLTLYNGIGGHRDSRSSLDDTGSDFGARSLDSITSDMSMITVQEADHIPKRKDWVRDETVNCCTNCRALFDALNRRHHCRLCGKIFCKNCCNRQMHSSEGGTSRMERTCNDCHDRLSPPSSSASPATTIVTVSTTSTITPGGYVNGTTSNDASSHSNTAFSSTGNGQAVIG